VNRVARIESLDFGWFTGSFQNQNGSGVSDVRNIVQRGYWKMKISRLAPIAIACLALLMPRIITSGDAYGGSIRITTQKPDCTHKHKPHPCSGPTTCGSIPTTERTTNNAEKLYIPGFRLVDCATEYNATCRGKAKEGLSDCW